MLLSRNCLFHKLLQFVKLVDVNLQQLKESLQLLLYCTSKFQIAKV
jgi:hypothetical protein